jgi:hypothetical protein
VLQNQQWICQYLADYVPIVVHESHKYKLELILEGEEEGTVQSGNRTPNNLQGRVLIFPVFFLKFFIVLEKYFS